MYFWSETRERNMAEKYNYELYETFNEPNTVNYYFYVLLTVHFSNI